MEVIVDRFDYPPGTGERTQAKSFVFDRQVLGAWVTLTGYSAQYDDGDHNLQRLTVLLGASPPARVDEGWEVRVVSEFNLRDDNGDDSYSGTIRYTLFVELESFLGWLTTLFGVFRAS